MLQSIRDHTHGWIAGVIISLLILSFALWGIHSYFVGGGTNNVVVKVNGVEITKNQYQSAYERLYRQVQAEYHQSGQMPEALELQVKQAALEALIQIEVLKQASIAEHYRISYRQVDSYLANMPEFQVNGVFSADRFREVLNAAMFSQRDFIDLVKTDLLIAQPRLGILFTSFALPDEITQFMSLVGQERQIRYVVIPQSQFSNHSLSISPAEIQAYYTQHQDDFQTPEQVSIEYITLSAEDLMKKIHPTEEALSSFYHDNTAAFSHPASWKIIQFKLPMSFNEKQANQLVEDLLAGQSLQSIKAKFAGIEEDKTWEKGVTLTQIPTAWQNAVNSLTQAGQVKAVAANQSLVVLQVIGYVPAKLMSFDEAKNDIKQMYIKQQAKSNLLMHEKN